MFSFFCRQEALLAAISEKDANIALLELSSSKKKTQEEVAALKREKDRLVQQLKQQVCLGQACRRLATCAFRLPVSGQTLVCVQAVFKAETSGFRPLAAAKKCRAFLVG